MIPTYLKKKTIPIRHAIVKLIAPNLYEMAHIPGGNRTPRPMMLFAQKYFHDKPVTCCEIGVAAGGNAISMLSLLNIDTLYLIDPYETYVENGHTYNYSKEHENAKRLLSRFSDKVSWIIDYSSEAAKKLQPASLDLCYIDGNHEYPFVKADIEDYYPLIKRGGVIGGHDFNGNYRSVIRAVLEFTKERDLQLQSEISDWWIVKPEDTS